MDLGSQSSTLELIFLLLHLCRSVTIKEFILLYAINAVTSATKSKVGFTQDLLYCLNILLFQEQRKQKKGLLQAYYVK
jgi:hypothetical protein